jgi:hypothetical protein
LPFFSRVKYIKTIPHSITNLKKEVMKNLIIAITIALSLSIANAQVSPIEQNRQVIEFLKGRCLTFNKGQVPVKVDDLRTLTDSLDAMNVNYSRTTYVFYGDQINDANCGGGSSEAATGRTAVPFIKYRIYADGGLTYLEVVDGNSYF